MWPFSKKSKPSVEDTYAKEEETRKAKRDADIAKWTAENELKKKKDAANLYTTRLAFYGTYEEWEREQVSFSLSSLARFQCSSLARFQYDAMRNVAPPYTAGIGMPAGLGVFPWGL